MAFDTGFNGIQDTMHEYSQSLLRLEDTLNITQQLSVEFPALANMNYTEIEKSNGIESWKIEAFLKITRKHFRDSSSYSFKVTTVHNKTLIGQENISKELQRLQNIGVSPMIPLWFCTCVLAPMIFVSPFFIFKKIDILTLRFQRTV